MQKIIVLSRSKGGYGGMQTYAKDLHASLLEAGYADAELWTPFRTKGMLKFPSYLFFVFTTIRKLRALNEAAIVHCTDIALTPVFFWIRRHKKTATACGLDVIWKPRWYQWLIRRSLRHCDRVVAISRATKAEVEKRGVGSTQISVIPCGIRDTGFLHAEIKRGDTPVLLTIGRLVPRKGVEWFVEHVLPSLVSKIPRLQYYVIGEGKRKKMINKIVQQKGLSSSVQLLGAVDESAKNALIDQADLFIMPNISMRDDMEGFGIVCIEAASRGLPVVAADTEGIPDAVIPETTGLLFSSGDAGACEKAVMRLLEHSFKRESVRRATLAAYDWKVLICRYTDEVFCSSDTHRPD